MTYFSLIVPLLSLRPRLDPVKGHQHPRVEAQGAKPLSRYNSSAICELRTGSLQAVQKSSQRQAWMPEISKRPKWPAPQLFVAAGFSVLSHIAIRMAVSSTWSGQTRRIAETTGPSSHCGAGPAGGGGAGVGAGFGCGGGGLGSGPGDGEGVGLGSGAGVSVAASAATRIGSTLASRVSSGPGAAAVSLWTHMAATATSRPRRRHLSSLAAYSSVPRSHHHAPWIPCLIAFTSSVVLSLKPSFTAVAMALPQFWRQSSMHSLMASIRCFSK